MKIEDQEILMELASTYGEKKLIKTLKKDYAFKKKWLEDRQEDAKKIRSGACALFEHDGRPTVEVSVYRYTLEETQPTEVDLIAQNGNDGLHYLDENQSDQKEVETPKPKTNKLGKALLRVFFALLIAYLVFIQL